LCYTEEELRELFSLIITGTERKFACYWQISLGLSWKRGLLTRAELVAMGGIYREPALAVFMEEKQFKYENCLAPKCAASKWTMIGQFYLFISLSIYLFNDFIHLRGGGAGERVKEDTQF